MNCSTNSYIPTRRFGRTEINIPILSVGGMRFQQSWKDLPTEEISRKNQENLEDILRHSVSVGMHHIETARHYGTSETQLGWAMKKIHDPKRILQTKIPPSSNAKEFERELEMSFVKLGKKKIDLLSIHGINLPVHLEQTLCKGGCMEVVKRWQKKGFVGHVGFSTHGRKDLIIQAIESNQFDYVNLHWYFIRQENTPVLEIAKNFDLGVFIISPTDKGGHLHSPSEKLVNLCAPLHPIVFNDLFCLSDPRVHTISVGMSRVEDLDLHLQAINFLDNANEIVPLIIERMNAAAEDALGKSWMETWHQGLPDWEIMPGNINLKVLLWLNNLVEAWGLEGYAKARYGLLGNAGHWFPGSNADCLDNQISEENLKNALSDSPWRDEIPFILRRLRKKMAGANEKRLSDC